MRIDHAALINVGADVDVHRGHADDATRDVGACPNGGSSRDESDLILQRDRLKGIGILVEKWKPLGRVIDQTSDPEAQQDSFFRSEEHTSELQSRENLVCRLLLEKKKRQE